MHAEIDKPRRLVVEYDSIDRRLWILGQRCHHGATGSIVVGLACLGLAARLMRVLRPSLGARTIAAAALTGSALMAHDWDDRSFWFERGRGTQLQPPATARGGLP
jgi:hypothetical protein